MRNGRTIAALIVAAGSGSRFGADKDIPKQYQTIGGVPVLLGSISAFVRHADIDVVAVVIRDGDQALYQDVPLIGADRMLPPVIGGATRQISVLHGLEALIEYAPDLVLIHDAARPLLSADLIDRVIAGLDTADAVLPALGVTDTIKRAPDHRVIAETLDRHELYAAQTPQGFSFAKILDAHRRVRVVGDGFTDDTAVAQWAGLEVVLAEGSPDNVKITLPGDLVRLEKIVKANTEMETRIGNGYDVHPFVAGDAVILGGVTIAHDRKLKGHSDADAGLHVLTDAILGAIAHGDIGKHFPPGDEKWRGEPSETFLRFAVDCLAGHGGRIVNLDLTIVAERPKIGPHVQAMRENIARICGIDVSRVSVKATTSEKMGFVGREEGIATIGSASVEMPRYR